MSTRRDFLISSVLAALYSGTKAVADDREQHAVEMAANLPGWTGEEHIGILLYPGFTALDVFGPHHFFISMTGAKVDLVAEKNGPVSTDSGIRIQPTTTFAECPEKLSVLMVPGGTLGTLNAAGSKNVRDFVRSRGEKADWVCSVCTGSLILGSAGLLKGYEATSHWLVREQLSLFGAKPVDKRVVVDRNRVTGAGVTAGLDFGLSLVKQLRGQQYAEAVQLFSEYDPQPPLQSGSAKKADPELAKLLIDMHHRFNDLVDELARTVDLAM